MNRRAFFTTLFGVGVAHKTGSLEKLCNQFSKLAPKESLVMGYKGQSMFEAGYFYCPYIPMQFGGGRADYCSLYNNGYVANRGGITVDEAIDRGYCLILWNQQ